MTLSLIWAQAANGVIGHDGGIPWRLPEDLALFRRLTTGTTVVMGRRTWDSLPERFRPLPQRRNVVLTRQPGWAAEGAEVVHAIEEIPDDADPVWVIGGADVYALTMPRAGRAVVTELDQAYDGDRFAPTLPNGWHVTSTDPEQGWHTSTSGLRYRVRTWEPGTP
jgi:dihydrofolate reductase